MASYPSAMPTDSTTSGSPDKNVMQQPEPPVHVQEDPVGYLDVYIHHARDIHNICIYHKQDVYAKVCLSDDPETFFSTKIINGGGRNPVFDENIRLNVHNIHQSSLRCEIWMLSRVKNYLKDQLLGLTLVPLCEVVAANGTLVQDFSLSSTDLFHSPAGFVHLSLSYVGSSPEAMATSPAEPSDISVANQPDLENKDSIPPEYAKIEFPDIKVVNENKLMVSEYYGIPCDNVEAQCPDGLVIPENDECPHSEAGVRIVQSFSTGDSETMVRLSDVPPSYISTTSSATVPVASTESLSELSGVTESPKVEDKSAEDGNGDVVSSGGKVATALGTPLININMKQEQIVVQQDIVDMYMKSMQQFTESLAKMKLPMDIEISGNDDAENTNVGSDQKVKQSKSPTSRVFYGSRAFF